MSSCVGCFLRPLSVCCWLSPTCLCQYSLVEHCSVPCLWCFAFYDFSSLFEGWVCCFLFFSDLFCFVCLSRFRGLSVLDLNWCLMFRSSFCVHGCVPVCGYMYVLVCVCFYVRMSVHCLWCASLCAHGVLIWVFISLCVLEVSSSCLSRLALEVMLGRFSWQFD